MSSHRQMYRVLSTLGVGLTLLLNPMAPGAFAAPADNTIPLDLGRTKGIDWVRDDKTITVQDTDNDGVAFVKVSGIAEDGTRLVVADNTKATILLDNAHLNLSLSKLLGAYHGIEIGQGSELTVQLAENSLNSLVGARSNGPSGGAGIYVPAGTALTIEGLGDGSGQLSTQGFVAMAGIGAGRGQTSGSIHIKGGHVSATGGDSASGIGSGFKGKQGEIMISGGSVTAEGGKGSGDKWGGAGIGTGSGGNPGPIVITGGQVLAQGAYGGAGIGAGHANAQSSNGLNILISGGDITAVGDGSGAGIGSSNMLGATSKGAHQIVAYGMNTSINAKSGSKENATAIGLGDNDNSRIETFIAVGGTLKEDGKEIKPNLTMKVNEGNNSGAVILEVPKAITNVPKNKIRLTNGLNPEVKLAFQTTMTSQPLKFNAKGFETNPAEIKAESLTNGSATILFEPVVLDPVELPDTDAQPTRTFLAGMSDTMLLYVALGLGLGVITALIGGIASWRRAKYAQSMAAGHQW